MLPIGTQIYLSQQNKATMDSAFEVREARPH
jgi:hypothetical protein